MSPDINSQNHVLKSASVGSAKPLEKNAKMHKKKNAINNLR